MAVIGSNMVVLVNDVLRKRKTNVVVRWETVDYDSNTLSIRGGGGAV